MRKEKIIARKAICPFLDEKEIEIITEICFKPSLIFKKDKFCKTLLIFGVSNLTRMKEVFYKLIEENNVKNVIISGGFNEKIKQKETEYIYKEINGISLKGVKFFFEEEATNTIENVLFSWKIIKENKLNFDKIFTLSKVQHVGRIVLTILKNTEIEIVNPYCFSDIEMYYDNWFLKDEFREIIWAEFLRIYIYTKKGDLKEDKLLFCNQNLIKKAEDFIKNNNIKC